MTDTSWMDLLNEYAHVKQRHRARAHPKYTDYSRRLRPVPGAENAEEKHGPFFKYATDVTADAVYFVIKHRFSLLALIVLRRSVKRRKKVKQLRGELRSLRKS